MPGVPCRRHVLHRPRGRDRDQHGTGYRPVQHERRYLGFRDRRHLRDLPQRWSGAGPHDGNGGSFGVVGRKDARRRRRPRSRAPSAMARTASRTRPRRTPSDAGPPGHCAPCARSAPDGRGGRRVAQPGAQHATPYVSTHRSIGDRVMTSLKAREVVRSARPWLLLTACVALGLAACTGDSGKIGHRKVLRDRQALRASRPTGRPTRSPRRRSSMRRSRTSRCRTTAGPSSKCA